MIRTEEGGVRKILAARILGGLVPRDLVLLVNEKENVLTNEKDRKLATERSNS